MPFCRQKDFKCVKGRKKSIFPVILLTIRVLIKNVFDLKYKLLFIIFIKETSHENESRNTRCVETNGALCNL